MSTKFENMSVDEAIEFCLLRETKFKCGFTSPEDSNRLYNRLFDAIIDGLKSGLVSPKELPGFGIK